jgi:hypothetical protein
MAQPNIKWTETPDSSNVSRVMYHEPTQTICVQFHNGGLYTYLGASEEIYMGLVHAPSVGQYLHRVIKAFPYTRWESETELMDYLKIGDHTVQCVRCGSEFSTKVNDCKVCDECWADDPT